MNGDRRATAALLRLVHPGNDRFADAAWLDWLYDANPVGPAAERSRDQAGRRIGHVACIPQRWRRGEQTEIFMCTVNAATEPGSGRTLFAGLVSRIVRDLHEGGSGAVMGYGVTNDASSLPTLQRLRADLVGSLPLKMVLPGRPRDIQSRSVGDGIEDGLLEAVAAERAGCSSEDWSQEWTADLLRWRLEAPGADYAVHWNDDVLAVSARIGVKGVPVGALMKVLPRRGPLPSATARRVVGAIHRHHHVPVVVYVGFNREIAVRGIRAPNWVRPGPLNLFVISGDIAARLIHDPTLAGLAATEVTFGTFELLDFDAV